MAKKCTFYLTAYNFENSIKKAVIGKKITNILSTNGKSYYDFNGDCYEIIGTIGVNKPSKLDYSIYLSTYKYNNMPLNGLCVIDGTDADDNLEKIEGLFCFTLSKWRKFMKYLLVCILFILLISGCTQGSNLTPSYSDDYENINQQIADLESKNNKLEQAISILSDKIKQEEDSIIDMHILMGYEPYNEQYRLIKRDMSFYWMPDDKSPAVGLVTKGTLAKVSLAGRRKENGDDGDTWLFVYIVFFDTPGNNYGWIKESETDKYTLDNQEMVTNPIIIPKGVNEVDSNNSEDYDRIGIIEEWENGLALVMFAGGKEGWYNKKSIVYPPID